MANNWNSRQNFNTGYPQSTGYPSSSGYPYPGQNMPAIPAQNNPTPYPPGSSSYPQPNITIINQPQPQPQPMPIPMPMPMPMPQPGLNSGSWMEMPNRIANCPFGLEYLALVDQLLVHQVVEMLEVLTGYETNNKYEIKNSFGQKVYWAAEMNDGCTRNCCGSARPFDMTVYDVNQQEIMHFRRPLACSCCCFPCCLQSLEVSAGGNIIGSIEQEWTLCASHYSIKNHIGETILRIEGPICTTSFGGDVDFKILSLDGTQVGKISKQWSGLAKEMFTDADNFGISFPMNLDVRMKAVMLGACILIDMMNYEDTQKNNERFG